MNAENEPKRIADPANALSLSSPLLSLLSLIVIL